jgi:hypothetical protein
MCAMFAPVAQLVEVPVLETVGCQFESDLGHQIIGCLRLDLRGRKDIKI